MADFATTKDLETLWRPLKETEKDRAVELLTTVSDLLRVEASKVNKDLDNMILEEPVLATAAKSVVVDVVSRTLMTSTDQEPMTQYTEGALGYTVSGSYLVPGGGIFIKDNELKRLKLKGQRYGVIDFYGEN